MAPSTKKQLTTKTTLATKAKSSTATKNKKKGAATIRDPDAKPKRPLSAYNLFFQYERDMLLRSKPSKEGQSHESMHMTIHNDPSERRNRSKTVRPPPHGKIGFAELAKIIGSKWKSLDDPARKHFQDLAAVEKKRYVKECKEWKDRMERKKQLEGETTVTTTSANSTAKDTTAKSKKVQEESNKDGTTCDDIKIAAVRMLGEPNIKLPLEDDVLPPVPEVPTQSFNGPGEAHHSSTVQQSDIYNMLNQACEIAEEGIFASSAAKPTSDMGQPSGGSISYTIGAPSTNTSYTINPYGHNNYQHQHQISAFAPTTSTITSAGLPHPQHTNVAPNTCPREGYDSHDGAIAPKTTCRHHQLPTTHYQQHSWNTLSKSSSKVSGKAPRVVSNGSIGGAGFGLVGTSGVMDNSNFDGDIDILDFLSRIVSD